MTRRRAGLVALAACAVVGCDVAVVDLGSNVALETTGDHADAGPDAAEGGPVVTAGCPRATQAEIEALYGHPCNSVCADGFGPPRAVASSAELISVTAGKWITCSGDVPWPAGVVGIELQSGCTVFLLHDAPDGGVSRGVEVDDRGTFDVVKTQTGDVVTRAVELHLPTWTWLVDATTSDCPHTLDLAGHDGRATHLVAVPDANPPLR